MGIEYETILEDLANKCPSLLQYNPIHKKVPVLIHGRNTVVESLINETWAAGYRLLLEDPYENPSPGFWAKFGDDLGEEQEEALVLALNHLKFVEEHIKGKRLFGGDEIGFTDLPSILELRITVPKTT
uniref:Glutathione S-transferase n=1 Tax=Kalanchoe fedtschenkoi TaxID=63787 RepID=A0A7N0VJX0_KALFE